MTTHQSPQMQKQQSELSTHYSTPSAGTREDTPGFIPATVLPEQFYSPPQEAAQTQWHVALMSAVLTDAIECYQQQFFMKAQHNQRLAKEAETWLFGKDEHGPFAFVNVCAALGMEPNYIRRGLKHWRQSLPANAGDKCHAASVRRLPRIAV